MIMIINVAKDAAAAAEFGRNPVSKHQIHQSKCGNEQANAGRDDCRTHLARPNSQARTETETGKKSFSPFN